MSECSLKETIYQSIWQGIINGEYPPDYVFNEKALVTKFNVSKSPVRDALIELCSDGILRSIPRFGYEIVKITNKELQEIIRLRTLIEVDNLSNIVGKVSNDKIQPLRELVEETDVKIASGQLSIQDHWQNNILFHKKLYSISNNIFGEKLLDRCLKAETIAYSSYLLYTVDTTNILNSDAHRNIVKYISSNDLKNAIKALTDDLKAFTL